MAGTDWFLCGSCALALRGLGTPPRGVDVILPGEEVSNTQETFLDVTIEPIEEYPGWVARVFGRLFLDAVVSLAFDTQPCLDDPEPIDSGPYAKATGRRLPGAVAP